MPSPFHNAIKGTTAGAPVIGAFTPNAAPSDSRPWSKVPAGWMGLVRYEDGSAWELSFSYWNGTTLSRGTNQLYDSSTGSVLTLTSAATATMICDANEVMSHLGGTPWAGFFAAVNNNTPVSLRGSTLTTTGTSNNAPLAATNFLTEQLRVMVASATTANAQSGWSSTNVFGITSTSAGRGGWEWRGRCGASLLPTGPRFFAGMTSTTFVGNTGEPSALTAHVAAFAKDSTDTNIQLLTNSNAGGGTKIDTGIPLALNAWLEPRVWMDPGGSTVYGLLFRQDTGDIFYRATTTDVPGNGALMLPNLLGGLSGTTGTALNLNIGQMLVRSGL